MCDTYVGLFNYVSIFHSDMDIPRERKKSTHQRQASSHLWYVDHLVISYDNVQIYAEISLRMLLHFICMYECGCKLWMLFSLYAN